MTARFLVFEGGEASGKSTQARRLADRLDARLTREPGGTEIGEAIRAVVLDRHESPMSERTEALLMAAARAQHVAEVVEPTLRAGRHVVSDRYIGSSLAYQGHARGLGVDAVAELSAWATGGLLPDLVLLLDLPVEVARARRATATDRLEDEDPAFHARVRDGFLSIAARHPESWVVIDADAPLDDVSERITATVVDRLGLEE